MIKKTILITILLTILATPLAIADVPTTSTLDVTLLNHQPAPAQPGDVIDVWVLIHNNGGSTSRAGTITFLDSEPFRAESSVDRTKEFQRIPAGQNALIRTQMRVNNDANQGENNLRVRVQEQGDGASFDRQLPISIVGTTATISVVSATTEPEELLPGEQGNLSVRLENVGESEVRNLAVRLNFQELGFAPVGSSNSQIIRNLQGGEETTFTFPITVMPDMQANAYQLPMRISYDDEQGVERIQEETTGLLVSADPQLLVYFDRISITQQQKEGEAVLRFVNYGLSEIKLLQMEVLESENISVTSESPKLYVGNIRADDYRSTSIRLQVSENEQTVPVRVTYKDSLNRAYTQDFDVSLNLRERGSEGPGLTLWIVGLLALATAVWLYRKNKKKKSKK